MGGSLRLGRDGFGGSILSGSCLSGRLSCRGGSRFGCGGVAEIPNLQDKLIRLARGGFKHHTAICEGHYKEILREAFTTYLHYDWVDID